MRSARRSMPTTWRRATQQERCTCIPLVAQLRNRVRKAHEKRAGGPPSCSAAGDARGTRVLLCRAALISRTRSPQHRQAPRRAAFGNGPFDCRPEPGARECDESDQCHVGDGNHRSEQIDHRPAQVAGGVWDEQPIRAVVRDRGHVGSRDQSGRPRHRCQLHPAPTTDAMEHHRGEGMAQGPTQRGYRCKVPDALLQIRSGRHTARSGDGEQCHQDCCNAERIDDQKRLHHFTIREFRRPIPPHLINSICGVNLAVRGWHSRTSQHDVRRIVPTEETIGTIVPAIDHFFFAMLAISPSTQ